MDETGLKGLEEERRLAYVGITRAEELCTISFAANRRVYGQWQSALPSRFIDELPAEHVEVLTPAGALRRRLRRGGDGGQITHRGPGGAGRRLQLARLEADAGTAQRARGMGQPREARNVTDRPRRGVRLHRRATACSTRSSATARSIGIEGDKLDIVFDKAGEKKVVARFVVPAAEADDVPF